MRRIRRVSNVSNTTEKRKSLILSSRTAIIAIAEEDEDARPNRSQIILPKQRSVSTADPETPAPRRTSSAETTRSASQQLSVPSQSVSGQGIGRRSTIRASQDGYDLTHQQYEEIKDVFNLFDTDGKQSVHLSQLS